MKASKKQIIKAAELGILRSMSDFLEKPLQAGRLKRRFLEIQIIVDGELRKIYTYDPNFFHDNKPEISACLEKFGKISNWSTNIEEIHIGSVVAFCMALLENSESEYTPKLLEYLKEIVDYYERAENLKYSDLWDGNKFRHIWNNLNKEGEYK